MRDLVFIVVSVAARPIGKAEKIKWNKRTREVQEEMGRKKEREKREKEDGKRQRRSPEGG